MIDRLRKGKFLTFMAILALALVTFGLYLPQLGFYLDDWPSLFFQIAHGNAGTILLHIYDSRPLSGWFYPPLFSILGFTPLPWQIFTLSLRVLTVVFFWLTLTKIWPEANLTVSLAALLFLVYPLFMQQPIAVAYSVHWASFLCILVTFYLMILAAQKPRLAIPLTMLGMVLNGVGFALVEFFVGLEFFRPLLLWAYFRRVSSDPKVRRRYVLKKWAPYLLVWLAFVAWRLYYFQVAAQVRNSLHGLDQLINTPLAGLLTLGQSSLRDIVQTLVFTWAQAIDPGVIDFSTPSQILAWGIVIVAATGIYLFAWFSARRVETNEGSPWPWYRQGLWLGLAWVILGLVPGWLIDRHVSDTTRLWNDRFGLAAMPGAALLIVAAIEWLVQSKAARYALISILIGLAVGVQLRNLNDYRWSWIIQSRFYTQLTWRAPQMEPDTLVVSDDELFTKMGVYPTAFALNSIYPQSDPDNQTDLWFLTLGKYYQDRMTEYAHGLEVNESHWQAFFVGTTTRSLVVDHNEVPGACLWVLSPEDALNPLINDNIRQALKAVDLSLIHETPDPGYNLEINFPIQDAGGWCYYYQKADLARQYGQWDTVRQLWDSAQKAQVGPNVNTELVPFIEADIHTQNWDQAFALTETVNATVAQAGPYLCAIWGNSLGIGPIDESQAARYAALQSELGCGN